MTARELKQYAAEYFDKEDNPVLWRYVFKEHELQAFCEQLCWEQRDLCDTGFMNSNWDEHMECSKVIINAPMPDLT